MMVWNTAGSTLYKAVEQHNTSARTTQQCELPPKPHKCAEKAHRTASYSPLSQLTQDRDMLLLLAVLLVLMHEKADTKLILALAFVIFS